MSRKQRNSEDPSTLLPPLPDLDSALARLVAQIPAGRVATCGALAEALGFRGAAVWVAQWATHHKHHRRCRCYRIVRANGELGAYITGQIEEKVALLRDEGVPIAAGCAAMSPRVELDRAVFTDFHTDRPLAALIGLQHRVAALRRSEPPRELPNLIAGFDSAVSADGTMQAACVICDLDGKMVVREVLRRPTPFPYISTLLAFRELPAYVDLLERLAEMGIAPDLLMIDGSGLLHPRAAGVAVHFGVATDLPTIGVSKTRLYGRCDTADMRPGESRPVVVENETCGMAWRPSKASRKCVFVSPGHRCDLAFAERWVRQLTVAGRRLPEPLYWADRLSRQAFD